jgi:hypothetical protein
MGEKDNNMWPHHKMTHGPITRRHMSKRDEDTWVDKIITWRSASTPRGLILAHHVSVPFETHAARQVTCQHGQSHMAHQRVMATSLASVDGATSAARTGTRGSERYFRRVTITEYVSV